MRTPHDFDDLSLAQPVLMGEVPRHCARRNGDNQRTPTNEEAYSCPLIAAAALAFTLAAGGAGCKDKNSCDAVVDHTLSLMPKELAEKAGKDKVAMVKKCEELPEASRKCAMEAKDLEALSACPR